jgi:hypothetical protein
MRRRLQGQPDHVADSGLQLRVAGEPEGLGPLGLGLPGFAVVLGPPPRDRAVAASQLVGQQPTSPVGPPKRLGPILWMLMPSG